MDQHDLAKEISALKERLAALEQRRRRVRLTAVAVVVALGASVAVAQTFTTFAPNTPAVAQQINDNFLNLKNSITALTTTVGTLQPKSELSGMIAFFPTLVGGSNRCPTGWTEYTQLSGRTVVGLQAGGSIGSLVGSPLGPQENRVHSHQWAWMSTNTNWHSYDDAGVDNIVINWTDGMDSAGTGTYPLGRDTGAEVHYYTDVAALNFPYVQLLPCRKN